MVTLFMARNVTNPVKWHFVYYPLRYLKTSSNQSNSI
jgi:hypothetical protein